LRPRPVRRSPSRPRPKPERTALKRRRESGAIVDRKANRVTGTERDLNAPEKAPRVVTAPLDGASHDLISAIFFLRTQTLTAGRSFELAMSDSGRVYHVPVRVVETRKMKTAIGEVEATRVDLDVFGPGRPVAGEGRMSMWFSNDPRRIAPFVDALVTSEEFGATKPDPAIIHHALARVNAKPDDAVMFGDSLTTDIEAARRAGEVSIPPNAAPGYDMPLAGASG